MNIKLALLGVVLCIVLCSAKVTFKRSLVVSTEPTQDQPNDDKKEPVKDSTPVIPKIYEMKVDTNVSNRYAKTLITSKVKNANTNAQEATFSVVTPDKAFISGFTMEIDGKKYEAYVQEKEQAKQTYDQAVSSGQAAAHVAVSARDSNRFTVSVNLEPQSKAVFYLRYEELLTRKDEKYELVLNIHPGQPVKNLDVQVNIAESRPLKFVKAPSLRSGNEISKNSSNIDPEADIQNINATSAIVTFRPDIIRQKLFASSLGGKEENGLSGQFIVQYDVVRDPQGGEVLVDGGYFVHFFSPEDLPPLKKQVIFVLDTSGSMSGVRISQLKEAMNSILGELKGEDVFSIVEFNSAVKVWNVPAVKVIYQEGEDPYQGFGYYGEEPKPKKEVLDQIIPPSFEASADNIKHAKEVIQKLDAFGGTDIQSALKIGLQIVERNKDPKSHQPIIVFLTDGEPTVGEFSTEKIISKITELNTKKVPIFSLSFGDGADRDFLQKISLKNQGFARHIYEAADAYLQLEDFYKQISSPLLSDVTFKYVDKVANVTRKHFPILFGGGELYTTGKIIDPGFAPPAVEGWGVHGPIHLQPTVYQAAGSLERLWAYLTVKQLLEQRDVAENKTGPTQEALRLALKYSFVTDVSSLVVVKPNATSAVDTEDAAKTDRFYPGVGGFPAVPLSGGASYALARPMLVQHSGQVGFGSAGGYAPQPSSARGGGPYYKSSYPVANFGAGGARGGGSYYMSSSYPVANYGAGAGGGRSYYKSSYPVADYAAVGGFPGYPGPVSQRRYKPMQRVFRPTAGTVSSAWGTSNNSSQFNKIIMSMSLHNNHHFLSKFSYDSDSDGFEALQEPADRLIVSGPSYYPTSLPGSFNLPPPLSTTFTPHFEQTEADTEKTNNQTTPDQNILPQIPWLKDALNDNGTITLESGTYSLGLNETVTLQPECPNSVNNTTGTCTLLHQCPQIYNELTDLVTYKKHVCYLESFAAICCPANP